MVLTLGSSRVAKKNLNISIDHTYDKVAYML